MNAAIIIFGSGKNQLPFILKVKSRGFSAIVFDQDSTKIGAIEADLFFPISLLYHDEIIKKLENLDRNYQAIIARVTNCDVLISAHIVAKRFGLNFPSIQLIKLGTDKSFLMDFCNLKNIQIPETVVARNSKDLCGKLNEDAVYIIKPAMTKVGKESIVKCKGEQSVHQYLSSALETP